MNALALSTDVADFDGLIAQTTYATSMEEKAALFASALALVKGEFLPGYYNEWIAKEQTRLTAAYDLALRQYLPILEVLERTEEAVALANQILAGDPCQEEIHCTLMRLYMAKGHGKLVQRQADRLRQCLEAEGMGSPKIATDVYIENLIQLARQAAPASKAPAAVEESAPVAVVPASQPAKWRKEWAFLLLPLVLFLIWNRANAPTKHTAKPAPNEPTTSTSKELSKTAMGSPTTTHIPITLDKTPAVEALTEYGRDGLATAVVPMPGGGVSVAGFSGIEGQSNNFVAVQLNSDMIQVAGQAWNNPDHGNADRCLSAMTDNYGNITLCGNSTHLKDYDTEPIVLNYSGGLSPRWDRREKLILKDYVAGTIEFLDADSKGDIWAGGGYGKRDKSTFAILAKFHGSDGAVEYRNDIDPKSEGSSIQRIAVDKSDDSVYVLGMTERQGKKPLTPDKSFWIRHFDSKGDPLGAIEVKNSDTPFLVKGGVIYYHEGDLVVRAFDTVRKTERRIPLPLNGGKGGSIIRLAQDNQGDLFALFTPTTATKHAPFALACISPDGAQKWCTQINLGNRSLVEEIYLQVNRHGDAFVAGVSQTERKDRHFTIVQFDKLGRQRTPWVDTNLGLVQCVMRAFCLESDLNPVAVGVTSETPVEQSGKITTLMVKPY